MSKHVIHVRLVPDEAAARAELRRVGVDPESIPIMAPKMRHHVLKIRGLDVRAANILKQEMLAKGAEAAVAKWASGYTKPTTDVLLMGTLKQYRLVLKKLAVQPFGLRTLVEPIKLALENCQNELKKVKCGSAELVLGAKTQVMGVLNVTPDSFSDGGRFMNPDDAISHAHALVEAGADLIDVGGESTRPGAKNIDAQEEAERVIPIVDRLVAELSVPISVDTSKATVAQGAIDVGATIINDVTALQGDAEMGRVCGAAGVAVILMHMRGEPRTMQVDPVYEDIVTDLVDFFGERIEAALGAGIDEEQLMIDPGFGFGKTAGHNLELLRRFTEFRSLGRPLVVGTSRKSTIGKVLGDLDTAERLEGTAATVTAAILGGAAIVRVHDVREMVRVARMTDAIMAGEVWDG